MRNSIIFTMVVAIANTTLFAQAGTIPIGGKNRDYIVHAPAGLPENAPLVLALHPLSGSGSSYQSMSGWNPVADKEKFVVVYPTGITMISMGGSSLPGWDITGQSDVNFMLALIDTMVARYKIDRKRVYSTGYSMGGMLSYVLACQKSDKIAAIGSIAGYPVGQDATSCKPSRPVPVCHVHGADDTFVKVVELPPWIKKFVEVDKCQSSPKTTTGAKYKKEDYSPCENGNEVILYTITGMDHMGAADPSKFDFSATDTFWTFFSRHPAQTGVSNQVSKIQKMQSVSAGYYAGKIYLRSDKDVRSVRVFDILGKMILSWKARAGSLRDCALPVSRSQGRIYLITISGATGESVMKVIIP